MPVDFRPLESPDIVAMVVYDSWIDWLFSTEAIHGLLYYGALFSVVAFPFFVWRWFPLTSRYFSGLFVAALCPLLATSISAIITVHHFLESEALGPESYVSSRLQGPIELAVNGASVSTALILFYSFIYVVSRKRLSALRKPQNEKAA